MRRDVGEDGCAVLFAHGAMLRLWATVRATDAPAAEDALGRPAPLHNTGMIVLESHRTAVGGWSAGPGRRIGGPRLDDGAADGPAGEDPTGAGFAR